MRRQRNATVYTGRVGARMRPAKARRVPRVQRTTCALRGGPLDGQRARLEASAHLCTLPLRLAGQTGRYVLKVPGNVLEWEPV